MNVTFKPLCQLNEEPIQGLIQELGAPDTARFIRQASTGVGGYTEKRRERLADTSLVNTLTKSRSGVREATPPPRGT